MKKYIVPAATVINVQSENLMAMSSVNNAEGQANQFSNQFVEEDWDDED